MRVFHKDVKLYSDSDISIAAAVTDNDGKQHFCLCRTLSINVVDTNEQKDENTPGLDISAQAVTNGADTALAIEIHNYAEEIFDAVISDENIGVVEEIGDLPLGDSLFTLQREFMQDITLELTLSGKALDGSSMTAKANTIPNTCSLRLSIFDAKSMISRMRGAVPQPGSVSLVFLCCDLIIAEVMRHKTDFAFGSFKKSRYSLRKLARLPARMVKLMTV